MLKIKPIGAKLLAINEKFLFLKINIPNEKKAITENTKHYQNNWKKYSKSIF